MAERALTDTAEEDWRALCRREFDHAYRASPTVQEHALTGRRTNVFQPLRLVVQGDHLAPLPMAYVCEGDALWSARPATSSFQGDGVGVRPSGGIPGQNPLLEPGDQMGHDRRLALRSAGIQRGTVRV